MDKGIDDIPTSREGNEADSCESRTGPSNVEESLQTSASTEDYSLVALEREVAKACTEIERLLKEREERTKREREAVQRQRDVLEQREREARKKREREERERRERAEREAREREDMAMAEWAPVQESQLWQCEHFQWRCSVRFPCCGVFYPCHRCHNGSGVCDADDKKANQATHVKCANCHHKEKINEGSQTCSSCGARMSEYFCFKCKHFTGVYNNPFHCNKCGICRIYRDRSFHCDVCNVCLDKRLEGKHKCRWVSQQDNRHICLQEKQGQEGDPDTATRDPLEDQLVLQLKRIQEGVPGDGVDSDNESNPESESETNGGALSARSDKAVLSLIAAAAPESQEQINRLEKELQELKGENQTLQAELEKKYGKGDMAVLPAACAPAYRHYDAGVPTNVPPLVAGIDVRFLARHSLDRGLLESLQANVESRNSSLPEAASNMVSSSEDPISRRCIGHSYLRPSENDCCCREPVNDGQICSVRGTIVPTKYYTCCICLQDVFSGCQILPCSHKVHGECLIAMIRLGKFICPSCGCVFLRRG